MNPPHYEELSQRLAYLERLGNLAHIYAELNGGPPAYDLDEEENVAALLRGVVEGLGDRIPVHVVDFWTYDVAHRPESLLEFPLYHLVHFMGISLEVPWDDFQDPFQLVLALLHAQPDEFFYGEGPFFQQAHDWWQEQTAGLGVPPLEEVDVTMAIARLERLPEPWDGLWAIYRWFMGSTGYLFADVPCEYAHDMDWSDLTWDWATIQTLIEDYRAASRVVFEPAWALCDHCRRDPSALRVCFRLATGTLDAEVCDGELIIMEDV